jgi:hypothetical protein
LEIEKYYHEAPVWQFKFKHPLGGDGVISVHCLSDKEGVIMGLVNFSEGGIGKRAVRGTQAVNFLVTEKDLKEKLEKTLNEIMNLKQEDE